MYAKRFWTLNAAFLVAIGVQVQASDWSYRTDDVAGDFSTSFLPVALSNQAPDDLKFARLSLEKPRFGELRYGSFDAKRIAILVVPGESGASLYVDRNRDREITSDEQVKGPGPRWKLALKADFVRGVVTKRVPRMLELRYAKGTLLAGTVGYVEGSIQLLGQSVPVRRVDANANGRFADENDHVWFDFDRNDRWDVFAERFPFRLMNRHQGKILSCAADAVGERFTMSEVTGTGTIMLNVDALKKRGLTKLSVVLAGRAGTIVNVQATSTEVRVPPDRYRPITAVADFTQAGKDGKPATSWQYTFVAQPEMKSASWISVAKDKVATIQPLGKLDFELQLHKPTIAAGKTIQATPTWVTRYGLRIQSVKYGKRALLSEPKALVRLVNASGGKAVSQYSCGFA